MDDNKKTLGYIPSLEYVDEYRSEISNQNNIENSNNTLDSNKNQTTDSLLDELNKLENIINGMPNDMSDIIKDVYDQVLDFAEDELKDKEITHVPNEEEWEYVDDKKDDEDDDDSKDDDNNEDGKNDDGNDDPNKNKKYDDWSTDDFFEIRKETHTEQEIIEKEYIKNLTDLLKDYSTSLHNIISNFWTNFLLACSNKETSEINMILNNILLSSSDVREDAKHLLDAAVRFNIVKTARMDYYSTIFTAEETLKHLKQIKAIKELRLRYSNIEKLKGDTKTNQMNNNILTASKLIYNKKYDIAYENLYRYLNSSNKVLESTLSSWVQEIKSKQILIERQGIL